MGSEMCIRDRPPSHRSRWPRRRRKSSLPTSTPISATPLSRAPSSTANTHTHPPSAPSHSPRSRSRPSRPLSRARTASPFPSTTERTSSPPPRPPRTPTDSPRRSTFSNPRDLFYAIGARARAQRGHRESACSSSRVASPGDGRRRRRRASPRAANVSAFEIPNVGFVTDGCKVSTVLYDES